MFINLLTMRPIHDSNDVYRYCVGVQCELNPNVPIKEQVQVLDSFIKLIPVKIEVSSRRVGNTHLRTELHVEKTTDLDMICLLYTSPSPRDRQKSRMPSSA